MLTRAIELGTRNHHPMVVNHKVYYGDTRCPIQLLLSHRYGITSIKQQQIRYDGSFTISVQQIPPRVDRLLSPVVPWVNTIFS